MCGYICIQHMIISTMFHQSSLSKQVKVYFHFIINCLPDSAWDVMGIICSRGKSFLWRTSESSLIRKRMTVSGELLSGVRWALWRWLYLLKQATNQNLVYKYAWFLTLKESLNSDFRKKKKEKKRFILIGQKNSHIW